MSHLDELDEFEAELELSLKREYSAVFSLFRYCVLTQDATYLCNKLDVEALPQSSYPFFHVRMEDVWVWDKNRPTRIIPRAEVYTSGDVTVDELRGEGEEPRLTAEALAERIGQPLPGDDDSILRGRTPPVALRKPLREAPLRRVQIRLEHVVEAGDLFAELEEPVVEQPLRVADVRVPLGPGDRGAALGTGHMAGGEEAGHGRSARR